MTEHGTRTLSEHVITMGRKSEPLEGFLRERLPRINAALVTPVLERLRPYRLFGHTPFIGASEVDPEEVKRLLTNAFKLNVSVQHIAVVSESRPLPDFPKPDYMAETDYQQVLERLLGATPRKHIRDCCSPASVGYHCANRYGKAVSKALGTLMDKLLEMVEGWVDRHNQPMETAPLLFHYLGLLLAEDPNAEALEHLVDLRHRCGFLAPKKREETTWIMSVA